MNDKKRSLEKLPEIDSLEVASEIINELSAQLDAHRMVLAWMIDKTAIAQAGRTHLKRHRYKKTKPYKKIAEYFFLSGFDRAPSLPNTNEENKCHRKKYAPW